MPNAGTVRWVRAPGARGTEVHVQLSYDPPAGTLGAAFAKLFGEEPNQQLRDELRRFKQLLETGEIARSDSTPGGVRARTSMSSPAQPGGPDAALGAVVGASTSVGGSIAVTPAIVHLAIEHRSMARD